MERRHTLLPGSGRPGRRDATRIAAAAADERVEVTVELRAPALPDPDDIPADGLGPEEFAARYGARQADADEAARVLRGFGLTVDDISLATRSMRVSGPVTAMEAAFRPNLGIYRSPDQGDYRGREGDLHVPAELDGIVTGVFGLDQRRVARRKARTVPRAAAPPLRPEDLERLYRFPPGDGAGQRIAIAEFGGGYFADDMEAYCAKHRRALPAVALVTVNLEPQAWTEIRRHPRDQRAFELLEVGEVMMDVQIVAGLCPAAEIGLYFATFDQKGWVDLLDRVIRDRPVALSVSWGMAEDSPDWSAAGRRAINERLSAAATLGITVCVAAGDDGTGDQVDDGRAHVDFPSSSPFVLAVGGTMLTGAEDGRVEEAWWVKPGYRDGEGGGSTGGGVSTVFRRPRWQDIHVASLNPGSIDGRVVPDVAALAGPPQYDLTLRGRDEVNGGTSAAAPLWAALIARVHAALGGRQRFLTPLLYQAG
ncbi:MAG TPA: S53 family peptidase, partial [Candidatus Dormibacteraeota bacterium]